MNCYVNSNLVYDVAMAVRPEVTPNRRGTRSRETVLDAAERLMAEHGFEAATIAGLVEEAGIPPSSIYHYFGSKEGVLLAVMERGAERFFASLPDVTARVGSPTAHLGAVVATVAETLERQPDFLRLLVVMATQPPHAGGGEVERVVNKVREMALRRLRTQMGIAFRIEVDSEAADHLARFALVAFDGAFVARQAHGKVTLPGLLKHLPSALLAVHRELRKGS
jgi:AcrR family transcriptional regulator